MSVTRVSEVFDQQAEFNYSFTPDDSAERNFLVWTNNRSDEAYVIMTSGMVPLIGSPHPTLLLQTARKITPKRLNKSPYMWTLRVEYSDKPVKPPQDPNPLNRPAAITGAARQYSKYTLFDRDGNAILNSAKDPYDPIEMDDARWIIRVSKNLPYNAIPLLPNNVINQDPFTITQLGITGDTETLKLQEQEFSDIKFEYVLEGIAYVGITYRTFSFSLAYREEGWVYKTTDRGYRAKDPSDGTGPYPVTVQEFGSKIWRPVTKPVFLDGSGNTLQSGPDDTIVASAIVINNFNNYADYDFSALSAYCT